MITKVVTRNLIVALALLAVILAAFALLLPRIFSTPPAGTPPPPPTILAPRGALPDKIVGLQEWAQYEDEAYTLVGSGFLLALPDGEVVCVTTAHSVVLNNPTRPLRSIAFGIASQPDFVVESDTLYGIPGRPRTGLDMTVDYLLLVVDQPPDPAIMLSPDPRGAPQPGEEVALFSGIPAGAGGKQVFSGRVLQVDDRGAWVVMNENFDPSQMSGSPVLSEHTGQVIGMAIAMAQRETQLLIGLHPIGSLIRKAQSAASFPELNVYRR